MKKIVIFLFLLSIIIFPCFTVDKPIVTVLDFTTNNISNSDMLSIISLLSSALFRSDAFTVIDVRQRSNILDEVNFSNSGCSDESCQLEIGKILSAEMIIVGDMAKVGNRYIMSTKMMVTETGETIETFDGIYNDLDELIDNVFNIVDTFSHYNVKVITDKEIESDNNKMTISIDTIDSSVDSSHSNKFENEVPDENIITANNTADDQLEIKRGGFGIVGGVTLSSPIYPIIELDFHFPIIENFDIGFYLGFPSVGGEIIFGNPSIFAVGVKGGMWWLALAMSSQLLVDIGVDFYINDFVIGPKVCLYSGGIVFGLCAGYNF